MKPIWIVDDDQSIRFVLEKALLREGLPTRSFTNPREVMKALEAEGEMDEVKAFVAAVQDRMHGYVRKVERSHEVRPAQFSGFQIK